MTETEARVKEAETKATEAEVKATEAEDRAAQAEDRATEAEAEVEQTEGRLADQIKASKSKEERWHKETNDMAEQVFASWICESLRNNITPP